MNHEADNSKLRQEVTYNLSTGRKMFYEGETYDKEAGIVRYAKGLQSFQLWIQGEKDDLILINLKEQFNKAVDEYQKMKRIFDGKDSALDQNDNGEGKETSKMKEDLSEAFVGEKPNVKWTDIAGLENAKRALQEAVILPIKYPQLFVGAAEPCKSILLYGPSGTGKTLLGKACAFESNGTLFSISSADLISKYDDESEKMIKTLFNMAREKKPAAIFIDEIDYLCAARSDNENKISRRVKAELLVQMQGLDNGILLLGATYVPWSLDTDIRKSFEKRIYIPLPDVEARIFLIENNLKKNKHTLTTDNIHEVAKNTEGFSGSDMSKLVKDAAYGPFKKCQLAKYFLEVEGDDKGKYLPVLEKDLPRYPQDQILQKVLSDIDGDKLKVPDVDMDDFRESLKRFKFDSPLSQGQLDQYAKWTKEFGEDG